MRISSKLCVVAMVAMLWNLPAHGGETLFFQAGKVSTAGGMVAAQMNPLIQSKQKTNYAVIQFKDRITEKDKSQLKSLGVSILRYIPDDALLVNTKGLNIANQTSIQNIRVVLPYAPALKVSKYFGVVDRMTSGLQEKVLIKVMDNSSLAKVKSAIELNGLGQVQFAEDSSIGIITTRGKIQALSHIDGVEWIEPYPEFDFSEFKPFDLPIEPYVARDIASLDGYESGTRVLNFETAWNRGFNGKNQMVGFADTGLDSGKINNIHQDFQGQVHKGYAYAILGTGWNDPMGHGTHVAGSIAGSGAASDGVLKGGAYEAQLIVGGMWSSFLNNMLPPSDITKMFKDAFNDGARVHTNSWGSPRNPGAYDQFAQKVDQYMWDNPDMLVIFAAGNSGIDRNRDGRVDQDSLGSPATAKNVLSVGASENLVSSGGIQRPLGDLKDQQGQQMYPVPPLSQDYLSDDVNGIAAFSSRGPTDDGRIKPDVVAPGTNVLSVRSQENGANELWGAFNQDYVWSGGTSMSTPLVAGAAAVVRDYLGVELNMNQPSAAMMKAVLMHTSTDLFPGQYGKIGMNKGQEIIKTRPDINQGFGRVDMDRATDMRHDLIIDERNGVALGSPMTFDMEVDNGRLVLTLMYTDAPSSSAAGKALVNNLDVLVKANGQIIARGQDRINNFEYIEINNAPDRVTIEVIAENLPQPRNGGKLPFALIASGTNTPKVVDNN